MLVFYNKRRSGGHGALRAEANIFSAYGTHAARKAVLQARAPARTPAPGIGSLGPSPPHPTNTLHI